MRVSWNLNGLVASIGALAMVAVVPGCDDGDPVTPGTDTQIQQDADATTGGETTTDVPSETTEEVTPTDPCDPNPCLNGGTCAESAGAAVCTCIDGFTGSVCEVPPVDPCLAFTCPAKAASCGADGATYTTFSAGVCADVDGVAKCNYEVDTTAACTGEEICYLPDGCITPADLTTYTYGTENSYVTSLKIGGVGETPVCGFDLNGDDEKDNGLGKLAGGLSGLIGDAVNLETVLDEAIADATLTIMFEWLGFDGTDDSDVTVKGFYGSSAIDPFDFAAAVAGDGQFYVSPSSFNLANGEPLISFAGATTGDDFLGGPSDFILSIPIGPISLTLTVSETQLAGTATKSAKGVSLADGELGGAVRIEELVGAINAYIDTNCGCLNLPADTNLIDYVDDVVKPSCNPVGENNTCEADGNDICGQIANFCSAIFLVLAGDVDSDGDGNVKYDSLSVGVCVEAAPAAINGLEPVEAQ